MVLEIGNLTDTILGYEGKMKEFEVWRKKVYEDIQDLQQKSDKDGQEIAALKEQTEADRKHLAEMTTKFEAMS